MARSLVRNRSNSGPPDVRLIDINQIEQVFVFMRIIEKIHYGETEIIGIRTTDPADVKNTGDDENSTEIARKNSVAEQIEGDCTFTGMIRCKLICFCKHVVKEEILHRERNRAIGIGLGLNDKIEIGILSELEKIAAGSACQLGRHRGLRESRGRTSRFKLYII